MAGRCHIIKKYTLYIFSVSDFYFYFFQFQTFQLISISVELTVLLSSSQLFHCSVRSSCDVCAARSCYQSRTRTAPQVSGSCCSVEFCFCSAPHHYTSTSVHCVVFSVQQLFILQMCVSNCERGVILAGGPPVASHGVPHTR